VQHEELDMRKLLVSVAVATATLAAVPAAAQYRGDDRQWDRRDDRWEDRDRWDNRGPDRRAVQQLLIRLDQVGQRIDRSARRGVISSREAFGLRREANQIRNRLHRAGRNGLSGREFAELRVQVNRLEQRLRIERRDRDGRRF
jgi:hypothetical protein